MSDSPTIQEALGAFLASYRREHGLTLDDIATEARKLGGTWGPASIRNIEGGRAAVTLQTLLTLAVVLGNLGPRPLSLVELLGDTDVITVFDRVPPLGRAWFDAALSGTPVGLGLASVSPRWTSDAIAAAAARAAASDLPDDFEALAAAEAPTLAEARAAAKLHLEPFEVAAWAQHLWGRTLDDEAATRATSDAAQARGNATRKLVEEIRDSVELRRTQRGAINDEL